MAVMNIIRAYQMRGHLLADLDPLGISYGHVTDADGDAAASGKAQGLSAATILRQHKVPASTEQDWERHYALPDNAFIGGGAKTLSLREIVRRLEEAYCATVGAEFMHIHDLDVVQWVRARMETPGVRRALADDDKRRLLQRLIRATHFETFLSKKWPGEKRFGLEGMEVLVPTIKQIIDRAVALDCGTFVLGMAHRGRLNVIANVCRKPLVQIFTQFSGLEQEDPGSGDVKYHLGTRVLVKNSVTGKEAMVSMVANPSHLEVVAPVVQGRTRAEQFYRGDVEGRSAMSIHVHGDAAFSGEGVVYETLNLSNLPNYTTKGAIHIVCNNQVGFTTDPRAARSSPYCTDVGKVTSAPVFHVNADDPEACMFVADMAVEYRFRHGADVVIDLVGYRRNGHNEADEPAFTQPLMYRKIRARRPVPELYAEQLIKDKVVDQQWVDSYAQEYAKILEDDFNEAKGITTSRLTDWLDAVWKGFFKGKDQGLCPPTGVSESVLEKVGVAFSAKPPDDFVVHPGIERILKTRQKMVSDREVDWALGEALAFGSLLLEGRHVRLSGQDVERGTFSHRHHVLHHQERDMETHVALQHLAPGQAAYTVCNSSLSELGVLGFELGFSLTDPNALVLWEAQFGDFNNMAQCIHDQFLSSGQCKWVRQCGLVMLLPHGLEGMGPEHSSARPERFLQLCDDDPEEDEDAVRGKRSPVQQLADVNWIVANTTTPANYFHILRRQIALPFRKPLVLFTPKSLLRHPEARSPLVDMAEGTEFQRVIPAAGPCTTSPRAVRKLLLCSGKVFYDVRNAVRDADLEGSIAIARVEQLCPFPYDLVAAECARYPEAALFWLQEEHKNQGAWSYVRPRLGACAGVEPCYVGRPTSAAPATGNKAQYQREAEALVQRALQL
ncbi:2-oxoglutarate dehydrogenase complex component E1-like [Frankliniella occidentalis]|uniref:oxoglutarate dehydrogenase (succinyl-transferring) n=1 Tax=Frankliniella occidentalis TaxID=133901 RepID=A0A9C6TVD0_FRAOC|nr:2-oxoglutarate dehydrogenase complex component E1-like [Frankliniella occidentalis]